MSNSKVSVSTNRQFYQLSDGTKSFESPALFSKVIVILLIPVVQENRPKQEKRGKMRVPI